jgi:hypothetical protein
VLARLCLSSRASAWRLLIAGGLAALFLPMAPEGTAATVQASFVRSAGRNRRRMHGARAMQPDPGAVERTCHQFRNMFRDISGAGMVVGEITDYTSNATERN